MQIATLCYLTPGPSASKRTSMNLDMLPNRSGVSLALGSIRARFVELGYVDEDIRKLCHHHEVRNSKPMSDRGAPDSVPTLSLSKTQGFQCGDVLNRFSFLRSTRPETCDCVVKNVTSNAGLLSKINMWTS
jgi:hypothetical protein